MGMGLPGAGITGQVLRRWREARGWSTRQMAQALRDSSEMPLPPADSLMREIARWERGAAAPREEVLFVYHRTFPGIGTVPPPEGFAVFGGPAQPPEPPGAALARAAEAPRPDEVTAIAAAAIAAGAEPARTWALMEKYRDLYRLASDTAAILAALTGEGGGVEPGEQAG
jgi:transcriptional regulator with XRE-family HTH domain